MKTLSTVVVAVFLFLTPSAKAIEAWIVGAQLGSAAGPGSLDSNSPSGFTHGLMYGIDVGLKNNPVLDVILSLQRSQHGGGSGITNTVFLMTADLHLINPNDIDISIGAGPGLYFFSGDTSQSLFGLQVGPNVDVIINETIRLGVAARYHAVIGAVRSYYSATMRFGYMFGGGE